MVHESLDPDSAEDFAVLASRTAVALSMLASSSGLPRSSRPAPLDSAVWKGVVVQYDMMPSDGERDGKYQHQVMIHFKPDVGLPTHEDVYDFVGRVFLDVVDLSAGGAACIDP